MPDAKNTRRASTSRKNEAVRPDGQAPRRLQARALATRTVLIETARRIFARDGFENARLEDIASAAGKTRGAFYDHFHDKEDVFFAIFEEDIARKRAALRSKINADMDAKARREALVDSMTNMLGDRESRLLQIEFKLYANRHPRRQKRLANLHIQLCTESAESWDDLYPELFEKSAMKRRAQFLKIASLIDGLALNEMFDPGTISRNAAKAVIRAALEHVLGAAR